MAVDALFTLAIPLALLRPELPFLGAGFSSLVGPIAAYLSASLVPVLYLALSLRRARQLNAVTALAGGGALLSGALALWPLSGLAFAVRDSSGSLLLLTVATVSLLIRRPLFAAILRVALLPGTPERAARLKELLGRPEVWRATMNATRALQLKALAVAGTNIAVKHALVTAPFGTEAFNAQLAAASALMIPVAYLASALGYGTATWLTRRGLRRAFGHAVPLWGHRFWAALET